LIVLWVLLESLEALRRFCKLALFGVSIIENQVTKKFFYETKKRFKAKDLFKNPYDNGILSFNPGEYIILMDPVYPKVYWLGFMLLTISIFFTQKIFSWWNLPGAFISLSYLFFSGRFFFFMLSRGLRNKGYKDKIVYLNLNKVSRRLFENGTGRSLRNT